MHNNNRNFIARNTAKAYSASIHIAGSFMQAETLCRRWVMRGACVQVIPCSYIYTGGEEEGILVRLMQYPRFPRPEHEILEMAVELGQYLAQELCQVSFSIETPENVVYYQAEGYEKRS